LCEKRFDELKLGADYRSRLDHELESIKSFGFEEYFLIVRDLVDFAQSRGIRVGYGRGSAAGSLVSYLLDITKVDPLVYHLYFERFLNPGRGKVQFPDIDIDFQDDRRSEILEYMQQKYGKSYVANIITFGRTYGKMTIKDVGRVLDMPLDEVAMITERIKDGETLTEALKRGDVVLRGFKSKYTELFAIAQKIEGGIRNVGVHAAGIVIGKQDLMKTMPLYVNKDGELTTQWDMDALQETGFLKIDVLAAKIQSIISGTIELIQKKIPTFQVEKIPLDDKRVFGDLCLNGGIGLFQFDTPGMTQYVKQYQPKTFQDIVFILGLYRPATVSLNLHLDFVDKRKTKKVQYLHPCLEPVLNKTYGIIVFQEQVIQIAQQIAGFNLVDGAILTKMISKKAGDMSVYLQRFIDGCQTTSGIPKETAKKIWGYIEQFAGYAFNLSHATAYAFTTYQTAYLKTHFSQEYMVTLLNRSLKSEDKMRSYYKECRRMGIEILPSGINHSKEKFSTEGSKVRVGFASIKGVGGAGGEIVRCQPYTSFADFHSRVVHKIVRKPVIEALIQANCFAQFGTREAILKEFQDKVDKPKSKKKEKPVMVDFFKGMTV